LLADGLVSVIVPTFNSSGTLQTCLESVKRQTYPHIETLVVDNYSTDSTVHIARRYGKVFTKGRERSAQRNFGAERSEGGYLVFLDSDIELTPKVIEESVSKATQGYDAIIFPELVVAEGFWGKCRALEARCYLGDDLIEAPRFYRSAVFRQLGGFDLDLTGWEDWDLARRIRYAGYKVTRIRSLTFHHEGKVHPFQIIAKKYYYGRTVSGYLRKHRSASTKQIPILRTAYVRNRKILARQPIHAMGFIILKALESIAVSIGRVVAH